MLIIPSPRPIFTYMGQSSPEVGIPGPTFSSITPNSGVTTGGTAVVLVGSGFMAGMTVTIDGVACTGVLVANGNSAAATTPAGIAGARTVVIRTPSGVVTAAGGFTYTSGDLSIGSTFSGADWFSTYAAGNGTGNGITNPTAILDNGKWSGTNGGGSAAQLSVATTAGNYYKQISYDGSGQSYMTNTQSKWGAPAVGQDIIYTMLVYTHFVATMGQAHQWQFARSVTPADLNDYMLFTHMLYSGDRTGPAGTPAGYNWFIISPFQLSYPDNSWCCPIAPDTSYAINLRLHRESSTVARIIPRIYNLDGTVYADGSNFSNGNDDSLASHNLTLDNPALVIPGSGADNAFYGSMEMGNNGDSFALNTSNFIVTDNHSVVITSDSTFWPGARVPV